MGCFPYSLVSRYWICSLGLPHSSCHLQLYQQTPFRIRSHPLLPVLHGRSYHFYRPSLIGLSGSRVSGCTRHLCDWIFHVVATMDLVFVTI